MKSWADFADSNDRTFFSATKRACFVRKPGDDGKRTWTLRLSLIAALVIGAQPLFAQPVLPPAVEVTLVPTMPYEPERPKQQEKSPIIPAGFTQLEDGTLSGPAPEPKTSPHGDSYRFWFRCEILFWRTTNAPMAVPLVTSNTPPGIGALNEPGTTILIGKGSNQDKADYGLFGGGRLTMGGWLQEDYEYGWECTGFSLQHRSTSFDAASPGGTAPIVSIPFAATEPFNIVNPIGETALNSGTTPATANVHFTAQMWGLEINELAYLWGNANFYCTAVLGIRYIDLTENLTLTYTATDTVKNGSATVIDGFNTRNRFFGGQIGTRFGWNFGRWNFDTSAQVALGSMHRQVNIGGETNITNNAFGFADGTIPGGVFAQPSNIGRVNASVFTAVPELQLKLGYALTSRIQPYFAYNLLYLGNVARPGNQIDRNINPTQNAFFVPPGTMTGTAAPVASNGNIQGSDFWAQGVQFGISILY